jgi:hypothetical protein
VSFDITVGISRYILKCPVSFEHYHLRSRIS